MRPKLRPSGQAVVPQSRPRILADARNGVEPTRPALRPVNDDLCVPMACISSPGRCAATRSLGVWLLSRSRTRTAGPGHHRRRQPSAALSQPCQPCSDLLGQTLRHPPRRPVPPPVRQGQREKGRRGRRAYPPVHRLGSDALRRRLHRLRCRLLRAAGPAQPRAPGPRPPTRLARLGVQVIVTPPGDGTSPPPPADNPGQAA